VVPNLGLGLQKTSFKCPHTEQGNSGMCVCVYIYTYIYIYSLR
jgi:hypothetical protein